MANYSTSYPLRFQYILRAASVVSITVLAGVLATLTFEPELGLKLVWSLIVPAAPLIFFLVPNVWVSLCPFAILQSIPRRLNAPRHRELTEAQTRGLRLLGWGLLLTLVPARHLVFNHDALLLLLATLVLATVAVWFGLTHKGLSGWCMGVCPIRPVEMMYGQFTPEQSRPEICTTCEECNEDCSRLRVQAPEILQANNAQFKYLIFTFPGFVLGYYLAGPEMSALTLYGFIYGLSLVSLVVLGLIDLRFPNLNTMSHAIIVALAIYYAFVIPGLVAVWNLPTVSTLIMYAVVYGVITVNVIRFYRHSPAEN